MIREKEFAAFALNPNYEAFIILLAALNVSPNSKIYYLKKALIVYLKANEAPTKVFSKYIDFKHVFLPKLATKLLDYTSICNHVIEFINN